MFVSANAGGFIADAMRARNISTTTVRKTMQSIGFLGPAAFLGLVTTTTNPALAVAYMTIALALGSFSQSGVYANHQDIGPAFSGILLGIRCVVRFLCVVHSFSPLSNMRTGWSFSFSNIRNHSGFLLDFFLATNAMCSNTGAAIPGIVGVALTGYILDTTGSWSLVFGIAIFFYLLGTVVYNALGTGEKVF